MAIALELPAGPRRPAAPSVARSGRTESGDFSRTLKRLLEKKKFKFNSAELGRRGTERVWVISVETPSGRVLEVHAAARAGEDPFDLDQAEEFASIMAEQFK